MNSIRPRLGPRPLTMHVAQAEWAWRGENPQKLASFYRGIKAYRKHPYRRAESPRPTIWNQGHCHVYDYGPVDGWPIFVVPSLINQAYILDLMPGVSLLDELTARGFRSFLLDWGRPTSLSQRLPLSGWIQDYLEPAFDRVRKITDMPPFVLGYCMGGTLSAALACLRPKDIAGLILLATPWDFESYREFANPLRDHHALALSAGSIGATPVDLLQLCFANITPLSIPKKFSRFGQLDPHSQMATLFVAIEDWLNDGEPLGAEVAAECFLGWFKSNKPALGDWKIDGMRIEPANLNLPVFLAIPENDAIVPPPSALALISALRDSETIRPKSGHVGMVVGQKAKRELWNPMIAWLKRVSATHRNTR